MFTIKVIEYNGEQRFFEAQPRDVIFRPGTPESISGDYLEIGQQGELPSWTIYTGKVYVMNTEGRTIANYDLGTGNKTISSIAPHSYTNAKGQAA